jgi:hypothetical protein
MKSYNNCDKLKIVKLIIILKILERSNCNEDVNIILKNISRNIKHKNNAPSNNLGAKKNMKDKKYTEYILPVQELTLEDGPKDILDAEELPVKVDLEYPLPIHELPLQDDSECILPIDEVNIENLISTLPIILAEVNIDIPIEFTFKLKNPALDIKNMKNDLYLTNSTLLPMNEKHDNSSPTLSGKLFLEGFVRNKLDFSIARSINDNIINLDTECVIVYIPFKGTTKIQYKIPPVFSKEKVLGEYINSNTPPITCEIKEYKICETYTLLDKTPFNKDFPIEINFHTIKENIVINLSLTLLQKQDVDLTYNNNLK